MGATDFRTPHLDRIANDGVRFTDWYSNSPVCSPSRAALLSGRYPGNAGIRVILRGHRSTPGLPQSTTTLATMLGDAGYQTALSGKWHLGLTEESRPQSHGFNHSSDSSQDASTITRTSSITAPIRADRVRTPRTICGRTTKRSGGMASISQR